MGGNPAAGRRWKLRAQAGDILVVDNHRMLHGRTKFQTAQQQITHPATGEQQRKFTRLLVWHGHDLAAEMCEMTRHGATACRHHPQGYFYQCSGLCANRLSRPRRLPQCGRAVAVQVVK